MARRRRNMVQLAAGFGLAGLHSAMTVWYRLPVLAAASSADPKKGAELRRMVSEKASAMIEGAFGAQAEAARVAGEALTGRLTLADMASASAGIVDAGMRPAFRKAKGNSRRLRRRR
jgi:hypothetical protein